MLKTATLIIGKFSPYLPVVTRLVITLSLRFAEKVQNIRVEIFSLSLQVLPSNGGSPGGLGALCLEIEADNHAAGTPELLLQ
ncbi:MAG: hypothetical protein ACKPKO_52975, partial [Candidatus Fonsibacter sp.]